MAFDEIYREFVAIHPTATLWHNPDFLESLAPSSGRARWEAVTLTVDGEVVAALPYFRKQRLDGWAITLPPLVRYCGPLFDPTWRESVGDEQAVSLLLSKIASGYRSFDQTWPQLPEQCEVEGFEVTRRITHRIDFGDRTLPELKAQQSRNMRNDLRRAERHFELRFAEALDDRIHEVLEAPFRRQAVPVPYARKHLETMFAFLVNRGQVGCVCAYGPLGKLSAVSVFIRDARSAYHLVNGSVDSARKYSGGSSVAWRGTLWALEQGVRQVDYLGSDHPGIAANLRHLGGQPAEYAHVHRDSVFWTKALRSWRNRAKTD